MIRYALHIRENYEPIDKEKRAQVEENLAVGEAAPTHNELKTSPPTAKDTGTGKPAGLRSGPPMSGAQEQLAPQQGAMPPAAPPGQAQEVNLQQEPQPPPVPPNTSALNRKPSTSGKGKKTASREENIARIKKLAGRWQDAWNQFRYQLYNNILPESFTSSGPKAKSTAAATATGQRVIRTPPKTPTPTSTRTNPVKTPPKPASQP